MKIANNMPKEEGKKKPLPEIREGAFKHINNRLQLSL